MIKCFNFMLIFPNKYFANKSHRKRQINKYMIFKLMIKIFNHSNNLLKLCAINIPLSLILVYYQSISNKMSLIKSFNFWNKF